MDHGVTPEKLYSTMPDEPEKVYPYISIPNKAFEKGEYQPGDECCIKVYVKIKSMTENDYGCDLIKSEDCSGEDEK
jgi:hypothetical protein